MPGYRRGRGRCPRWVARLPYADFFKPAGVPLMNLEITTLFIEEFEALRDTTEGNGLSQDELLMRQFLRGDAEGPISSEEDKGGFFEELGIFSLR